MLPRSNKPRRKSVSYKSLAHGGFGSNPVIQAHVLHGWFTPKGGLNASDEKYLIYQ